MAYKSSILIIDDDPGIRDTLEALLFKEGYKLIFAANGKQGIEKAAEHMPDAILLDVMMPGMDGIEVCKRIRADDSLAEVPIIMLTGLDDNESKLSGIKSGADDYISKPYNKDELRAKIRTIIRLNRFRNLLAEKEKYISAIKESESLYRTLTESMPYGALLVQEGKIVFANKGFNKILNYKESDSFVGEKALKPFQRKFKSFLEKAFDPVSYYDNGENEFKGICFSSTGREIFVSLKCSLISWKTAPAILATVRDITLDVRREAQLKEKSEKIKQENIKLKSSIKERYRFGKIVGKSPAMQKVYESILSMADTDAGVMITGESGTGKELVANAIHDVSDRSQEPFYPVNCGAIPENLFESEFFGHNKGAFTGADTDKKGYLQAAHNGTLFLDEIGELSLASQVKLLRVLENGSYTPLGSTISLNSNFRLISASNRNLYAMMKEGLIREDFYYRIKIFPIVLPPLRDRREDIPLLIEHFLKLFNAPKKMLKISGRMMDVLKNYHWPGNIREMHNIIHQYMSVGNFNFLEIIDPANNDSPGEYFDSLPRAVDLKDKMSRFEKAILLKALNENHWKRGQTASALKIGQRTLFTKMKKFGLL